MADKNKVMFGISNLHVGTYNVSSGGTVTLGAPYHQKGAVGLSMEPEGDSNDFYADNTKYWSGYSDQGFTGTVEVAKFDDEFKKQFLNYVELADGGIAKIKGASRPNTYVAFQTEGDAQARRVIMYNVSWAEPQREYNTTEDSTEPATDSSDITVSGDNDTGITVVTYNPGDSAYNTLFTSPPVPSLPANTTP